MQLSRYAKAFASVLSITSLVAFASVPALADEHPTMTYTVSLAPLNDSGVSGTVDLSLHVNDLTATVNATGLVPNQVHPQHIHGFTDGTVSACPTPAADTNGDGIISLAEGLPVYGDILQPLTPYPTADSVGNESYMQTLNIDPAHLGTLTNDTVVLHGLMVNGAYDPTTPVACGVITMTSSNGNGTSSWTPTSSSTNYYPSFQPSSYYVLPGQMLSFSGSGFMPGEQVSISSTSGQSAWMTSADGSGNINTAMDYTAPFSMQNSMVTFTANGQSSNTSVSRTVAIGTYYPQLSPSSYYLPASQQFSVSGNGFAPNEPVTVLVGSMQLLATADGSGNFNLNAMAPNSAGNFTVSATGQWSNTMSQRSLTAY
jgi:hypothetical protein